MDFNASAGTLEFRGRAIPEHPNRFFSPLIDWIEAYVETRPLATTFSVAVDYLNSSSQRYLLELLERLGPLRTKMRIHWYYEEDDEEILRIGEDLAAQTNLPFNFIPVAEVSA